MLPLSSAAPSSPNGYQCAGARSVVLCGHHPLNYSARLTEHFPFPLAQPCQPNSGPATADDQGAPSDWGSSQAGWGEEEARGDQSLTFDIAVEDPAGMEVFQPFQGLAQVVEGSVLRQTARLLYELAQRAT